MSTILEPLSDGLQLLALDHNRVHRQALHTMLSAVRIEPFWLSDEDELIRACRSARWDMALVDVGAGARGLDPVKALRAVERREGLRRTPVVALVTAVPIASHKADYMAAGVDAIAGKPIHLPTLLRTVEQVLHSDDQDLAAAI